MRRRRNLSGIESTVLAKGTTGVIEAVGGLSFPGFGLVIGFLLNKLFEDRPNNFQVESLQRLQQIGERLKARDYAGANFLFSLEWAGGFMQGQQPGIEKMFFIARAGDAIENGNRAGLTQLAAQIDRWQAQWDAWKVNVDADIAAGLQRNAAQVAYAEQGGMDTDVRYDDERGDYVITYQTDDGERIVKGERDG